MKESIKFGIVASCPHPQIDYTKVNYSKSPYASQPFQTVTYAECHDNHVLWDKLAVSAVNTTEAQRKEMQKLSLAIVLTSQGISFLHAGTEFLRSKQGNENSYNAGDAVNGIDWTLKTKNRDVYEYVRSLITMRKEHPAFRMRTAAQIATNIHFVDELPEGVLAYTLDGAAVADNWQTILVVFNANANRSSFLLPASKLKWQTFGGRKQGVDRGNPPTVAGAPPQKILLSPYSCSIFYQSMKEE